jgi:hypothetical protein
MLFPLLEHQRRNYLNLKHEMILKIFVCSSDMTWHNMTHKISQNATYFFTFQQSVCILYYLPCAESLNREYCKYWSVQYCSLFCWQIKSVFLLSTESLLGLNLHNDYIPLQENCFSFIENKIHKHPFIISGQVQADLVNIVTYYLHFWQFLF